MDKVFSARLDESAIHRISALAQQLGTTKKAVIEHAIEQYAAEIEKMKGFDILEQTSGAWQRRETSEKTVEKTRRAFRRSMDRHQR